MVVPSHHVVPKYSLFAGRRILNSKLSNRSMWWRATYDNASLSLKRAVFDRLIDADGVVFTNPQDSSTVG